MKYLLMFPIWIYKQTLSKLMPNVCRFTPTCATYFLEALDRRGAIVGTWLGVRRLCRCHPWGGEGYDPVPLTGNTESRNPKIETKTDTAPPPPGS